MPLGKTVRGSDTEARRGGELGAGQRKNPGALHLGHATPFAGEKLTLHIWELEEAQGPLRWMNLKAEASALNLSSSMWPREDELAMLYLELNSKTPRENIEL